MVSDAESCASVRRPATRAAMTGRDVHGHSSSHDGADRLPARSEPCAHASDACQPCELENQRLQPTPPAVPGVARRRPGGVGGVGGGGEGLVGRAPDPRCGGRAGRRSRLGAPRLPAARLARRRPPGGAPRDTALLSCAKHRKARSGRPHCPGSVTRVLLERSRLVTAGG